MNLQSNALKYTKEGGFINISVTFIPRDPRLMKEIEESYFSSDSDHDYSELDRVYEGKMDNLYRGRDKDKLLISVLDSGVGISSKDQQSLFKMFGSI